MGYVKAVRRGEPHGPLQTYVDPFRQFVSQTQSNREICCKIILRGFGGERCSYSNQAVGCQTVVAVLSFHPVSAETPLYLHSEIIESAAEKEFIARHDTVCILRAAGDSGR